MALAAAVAIYCLSCWLAYRVGHTDGRREEAAVRELTQLTEAARTESRGVWQ